MSHCAVWIAATRSLLVTVISLRLPKQILHPSEEEEGCGANTVRG